MHCRWTHLLHLSRVPVSRCLKLGSCVPCSRGESIWTLLSSEVHNLGFRNVGKKRRMPTCPPPWPLDTVNSYVNSCDHMAVAWQRCSHYPKPLEHQAHRIHDAPGPFVGPAVFEHVAHWYQQIDYRTELNTTGAWIAMNCVPPWK